LHRLCFAAVLLMPLAAVGCSGGGASSPAPRPSPSPTANGLPAITEYNVGPASPAPALNAASITAGPDGALWFLANTPVRSVGRITMAGTSTLYPAGAFGGLIAMGTGPDGALWFTGSSSASSDALIGRISTAGSVTSFDITQDDPHLTAPYCIATGSDGALWFTNFASSLIGRITTTGTLTTYSVTAPAGIPQVNGVVSGPDGALWYTGYVQSITASKIQVTPLLGRITTAGTITDYNAAAVSAGVQVPDKIVAGPDGSLWFADWSTGHSAIGRMTTGGSVTEFTLPATSRPTDITVGPDNALWFADGSANAIGRITTGGSIVEYSTGISPNASPSSIALGADGALWFTELNYNKVGRLVP